MWNRNFLLLWQGMFVSQIGTQLFSLALLYWILETTGSATAMGLVLMAAALPGVILGPFAGTLADNVSRKVLIVWADVIRGLAAISFVLVLWHGDAIWALPTLFAAQVIFGCCGAAFTPAVNASVPELVPKERLVMANSLLQGSNALTTTATFGVGGFLYAAVGAPWLFLLNGISYLISATSESFISIRQDFPEERMTRQNALAKFRKETVEGLRYVWNRQGLRTLVGMLCLINFVLIPTGIALPILVRDFLHRGPEFLGIMASCQAFGSLAGFVIVGAVTVAPQRRPYLVLTSMAVSALSILALGFISNPMATLPVVGLFGLLLPLINVNIISLLQGTTPSKMRGRVMGVLGTVVLGLIPVSQGLSGLLIDAVDQQVPLVYQVVGGLFASLVLMASMATSFRAFLATDYAR